MTIRVLIGTTEGPAEIQRLTQEPAEIRSVVCLDGRAVALPISRDYESFVRRPSGIVERIWGGPAFRMDVGARITDGLSWQLGAFLAHGLHAAGALATRGMSADTVVWATGEVDAALDVREVDEIPRKLELSHALLRELGAVRPWVMVPAAAAAIAAATLDRLDLAQHCRLLGVTQAAEALAAIGVALPGADAAASAEAVAAYPPPPSAAVPITPAPEARAISAAEPPAPLPFVATPPTGALAIARRPIRSSGRRGPRRIAMVAAALVLAPLAAAGGWLAWDWHRTLAAWTAQAQAGDLIALDDTLSATAATPGCLTCAAAVRRFRAQLTADTPALLIAVEETRSNAYGGCPRAAAPPPVRVALAERDGLAVSTGTCRVRYVVSGAPAVALSVAGPAIRRSFEAAAGQTTDTAALGDGEASVLVDLPPLAIYASEERIVAIAAGWPLGTVWPWLRPQLPPPPAPLPPALLARLSAMGIAVRVLRHRIDPAQGL